MIQGPQGVKLISVQYFPKTEPSEFICLICTKYHFKEINLQLYKKLIIITCKLRKCLML